MPISNRKLKKLKNQEWYLRYREYLSSNNWKAIRSQVALLRGYQCERCNIDLKNIRFDIHHKTYENIFKEKLEDLELLCRSCHKAHHRNIKLSKKKNRFSFERKCQMLETKSGRRRLRRLGYNIKNNIQYNKINNHGNKTK